MAITDGFLFFKDWEPSMRGLSKKDFFALFWAMYDYQMYGKGFPNFTGKAQIIASFIEPQLKRRVSNSISGARGGEKKRAAVAAKNEGESLEAEDEAKVEAVVMATVEAVPVADREERDEISQNTDAVTEESENLASIPTRAESGRDNFLEKEGGSGDDLPQTETEADPFAVDPKGNVKRIYGKRENVLLTPNERGLIRATIPDSDAYIDMFSEKLYSRGYSYSDHCEAILRWWEKDKKSYFEQGCGAFAAENDECIDPNARYRNLDSDFERACRVSKLEG